MVTHNDQYNDESNQRRGNLVLTLNPGQTFFLIHPENESFIGFNLVSPHRTKLVFNATPRLIILREKLASHHVLEKFREADVSMTVDLVESLLMVIHDENSSSETVGISTSVKREGARFEIKIVDANKSDRENKVGQAVQPRAVTI